jgi:hypothetical protein
MPSEFPAATPSIDLSALAANWRLLRAQPVAARPT